MNEDLFLFHSGGQDKFYCYVLTELTHFFAVHCYYELQWVGNLRYPGWVDMQVSKCRDDPSPTVETC